MSRLNRIVLWFICIVTLPCWSAEWLWTGAASSNWSSKANWSTSSPDAIPAAGDTLRLATGTFKPSNQDIPNLSVRGITLSGGIPTGTVVSGLTILLGADGLLLEGAATDVAFATPFKLTQQQTWQIAAGRTLQLSGALEAAFTPFQAQATANTGSTQLSNVTPLTNIVRGLPITGQHINSTWVQSVSGSTLTLTRTGQQSITASVTFTPCWIIQGGGTLDLGSASGADLDAPMLIRSGTVRFSPLTQLKRGAILDRDAVLELKAGSGSFVFQSALVSLGALAASQTEPQSPAILAHAGDTISVPFAAGTALNSGVGGGTENVYRTPGAGQVRFLAEAPPPTHSSASFRLEGGGLMLDTLALQPAANPGTASGLIEFAGTATLAIQANETVATTDSDGRVAPAPALATDFTLRYGPRQLAVRSGIATLNIASGAVFQNNLAPFDDGVLVAAGATLRVHGADDHAVFRIGRNSSSGALSPTLNTGRFDLRGGHAYIHAVPASGAFAVFPRQPGFTLALNGGVFNGNRVGDFEGHLHLRNDPSGTPRLDNLRLSGSGDILWGAGVVEKINVTDHPDGHDSTFGLHRLDFSRSGGGVQVAEDATLRISAGTVSADGADPFSDTSDDARRVSIENNATLRVEASAKKIGNLSGISASAKIELFAALSIASTRDTTYAGRFQGNRSVTKAGTGALYLSGDNSAYSGLLTIQAGTLVAEHAVSATGTQSVLVQSGGVLAGSGRVPGGAEIHGELRPGNIPFAAGDNTLETGALTLQPSSTLRFFISGTEAHSAVADVSGNLALLGGAVVIEDGGGLGNGDYVLMRYSGALTGTLSALTLSQAPGGFSAQLLHDGAQKKIILRLSAPPVSTITAPLAQPYRAATWPGQIAGSTLDANGVGLSKVEVSVRRSGGDWFDGTAFNSAAEVWLLAALNGSDWSLPFPLAHFATDGAYILRVRATDSAQNFENPPAQRAFSIDRVAPTVTVNGLSTQSATPALSGSVDDPSAAVFVTLQGHGASATNHGAAWTLTAGTLPGLPAGVYNISVQATDAAGNTGFDATLNELTIALPDISLLSLAPTTGSAAGGTAVTLIGTNLDLVTGVRFGAAVAAIQSKSASSLTVLTPEHAAGVVTVSVESLSNTVVLPDAFTYFNPPPTIASITPARVCTDGSSQLTILGSGFLPGVDVQVRGKTSSEITRVSAQKLLARAPANAPGTASVTVVNPDRNAVSLPNAVLYDQPPQLSGVAQLNSSQVQANSPVHLLFELIDPEGGAIVYSIDWGDGSPLGTATQHTYTNPGTYTLTLSASDGIGTSVHTLVVLVGGGGATPETPLPPQGTALTVESFSASVRFDVPGKDTLQIKLLFPALPPGISFAGSLCSMDAGGAREVFTLDAKGKSRSASGTLTLRGKFTRDRTTRAYTFAGGAPTLVAKLKGTYSTAWSDEGVASAGASGASVPFALSVTLGGVEAAAAVVTQSKIKTGKSGRYTFRK